jgi:hypothetical protein
MPPSNRNSSFRLAGICRRLHSGRVEVENVSDEKRHFPRPRASKGKAHGSRRRVAMRGWTVNSGFQP